MNEYKNADHDKQNQSLLQYLTDSDTNDTDMSVYTEWEDLKYVEDNEFLFVEF